jgi:hypothetical protein
MTVFIHNRLQITEFEFGWHAKSRVCGLLHKPTFLTVSTVNTMLSSC